MTNLTPKPAKPTGKSPIALTVQFAAALLILFSMAASVWADGETTNTQNNMISEDTGIAVNGDAAGNLNNNQNTLRNGDNTNLNLLAPTLRPTVNSAVNPVIYTPTQTQGGSSVLVMPRNPLNLPNATLGRSNFGLQFGVQNNPGLSPLGGSGNALGWFMQGGVTIPFGRIPDALSTTQGSKLDDMRQGNQERARMVFGNLDPRGGAPAPRGSSPNPSNSQVRGQVVGLSAYNFSTLPSSKIALPESFSGANMKESRLSQPKVLALTPAEVYTKPLNIGEKVGVVEVGTEYPYLGHTRSGWVKLLLPNGSEGWTSSHFEYIKNDFTEIDSLAVDPTMEQRKQAYGKNNAKILR